MINIRADQDIKSKAQRVAHDLGMPLSTIINAYLRQLIRTKEIHFSTEGELKPAVKKRLDRIHEEVREGKNLSPVFHNAKAMDSYLDSL
ncbi:MAG: type II toxin-antitoxin system RelB/DinJ family antitoxin [Candidatus Nealsonbacteria bacterium]|nr:type II toxin-antitoxin system RelB/DinJ family antitoxin [Candidatus Nealsonbacteria bacterium]